jgi:hypothetical protein
MAFENLFIRTKRSIAGISLDGIISEDHTNQVRLTKNPVELGADVADHAVIEPKKLSIVAEVSDTPIGTAAFTQIVDTVTGLFGSSTVENITRSNAAYRAMLQIQELREPIQVQTKLRLYDNMLITSLRTVQDKDSSRIVRMLLGLEEVIITESETIQLQPDQLPEGTTRQQASPQSKRGRQEPSTPTEDVNRSVLKSVTDWLGK